MSTSPPTLKHYFRGWNEKRGKCNKEWGKTDVEELLDLTWQRKMGPCPEFSQNNFHSSFTNLIFSLSIFIEFYWIPIGLAYG